MDFRLREERDLNTLPERLTAVLPDGIKALEAYEAERKSAQLKWLEIEGLFEYDSVKPTADMLDDFFRQPELVIERKTKRGLGQTDIRPAIQRIEFSDAGDQLRLQARISAQEPTLNPDHLVSALKQLRLEIAPNFAKFTRLETYDEGGNVYR
jgi:radical SAM-linked protein